MVIYLGLNTGNQIYFVGWKINDNKYVDGGFTDNLVNLYPGETIRVQPFSTASEHSEVSPLLSNPKDEGRIILKYHSTFTFFATKENIDRVAIKVKDQSFQYIS